MIRIVPASSEHVRPLLENLRAHDQLEFDMVGFDPAESIERAIKISFKSWTALLDDSPMCMWGLKEDSAMTGAHLWLITTPLIEKYKKTFLIGSKRIIQEACLTCPLIYGFVDNDYVISKRWMEWLGFSPVQELNVKPMKLVRYEMRADHGN